MFNLRFTLAEGLLCFGMGSLCVTATLPTTSSSSWVNEDCEWRLGVSDDLRRDTSGRVTGSTGFFSFFFTGFRFTWLNGAGGDPGSTTDVLRLAGLLAFWCPLAAGGAPAAPSASGGGDESRDSRLPGAIFIVAWEVNFGLGFEAEAEVGVDGVGVVGVEGVALDPVDNWRPIDCRQGGAFLFAPAFSFPAASSNAAAAALTEGIVSKFTRPIRSHFLGF
jgi:hypothetical protein